MCFRKKEKPNYYKGAAGVEAIRNTLLKYCRIVFRQAQKIPRINIRNGETKDDSNELYEILRNIFLWLELKP